MNGQGDRGIEVMIIKACRWARNTELASEIGLGTGINFCCSSSGCCCDTLIIVVVVVSGEGILPLRR